MAEYKKDPKKNTLAALVSNKSGVLTRISGLFARRGYNIESLTVCATEDPELSRMTIVLIGDEYTLYQMIKQMDKLDDVKKIGCADELDCVYRELLLVKVPATADVRSQIVEIKEIYKAKVVDLSVDTMILELTGIPTGFHDLDNLTRGLHAKEMIVIAGRPGTGKTSIALNMVESAIFGKRRSPTLIFSLEMGADQLYVRLISSMARVDQQAMRSGRIQKSVMGDIMNAAKELKAAPLWIDDTMDMNILEMRAKARRLAQQLSRDGQKLGLIVLDYIQLLKPIDSRIPREQQVAEMSRGLKAMSKELDVPVIVLAQLNRDSEKDKRDPRASDLRESGSIEQDADVIFLLSWQKISEKQKDEQPDGNARLVRLEVAKQRNGPTGYVNLIFNRNYTRYENYLNRDTI